MDNIKREYVDTLDCKRLIWLDAVKGLGIILIMFSHIGGIPFVGKYLFACFIPLFFIASGYTLRYPIDTKAYLAKKGKRLLIPYFVYGLFLLLIKMRKVDSAKEAIICWIGLLYSRYCFWAESGHKNIYFMVSGNSPHWFLTALFVGSVLAIPLIKTRYKKCMVILYLSISVALDYLPVLLPWGIDMGFLTALFIWIGMKMKDIRFGELPLKQYVFIVLSGSLLYVMLVNYNGGTNMSLRKYGDIKFVSIFLFVIIGVLGTAIYISIFKIFERFVITALLGKVGRSSLTIMCLHMFFFSVFDKTIGRCIANEWPLYNCAKVFSAIVLGVTLSKLYCILYQRFHFLLLKYL